VAGVAFSLQEITTMSRAAADLALDLLGKRDGMMARLELLDLQCAAALEAALKAQNARA
jgi:hypothetical protein